MKTREASKVYFPGLNGLRFFAAILVVAGHVELMKSERGFPNAAANPAVDELGRIAVTFFFVLSGFLITYLLLEERRVEGTISVRKFYIRRVLRIWPLYYATLAIVFLVIRPPLSGLTLMLFLLFLPQLAESLYPPVPYAQPLWSIGVEEQFYLLWPVVLKHVRRVVPLSLAIIAAGFLIKQIPLMLGTRLGSARAVNAFINYWYLTRIECMAVGALAAWAVFEERERILRFVYSRATQIVTYALMAWTLVTPRGKPVLHYTGYSLLFAVLIMNTATNRRSLIRMESKFFTFLGDISYAMYMLHEFAIAIALNLVGGTRNAALYALSIALTVAMASVSFLVFERKFLKLKSRFAVVRSGAD